VALAAALDRLPLPRPLVLIAGILADKRWDEMLPPLLQRVDATERTVPTTPPDSRRWSPVAAAGRIGSAGPGRAVPDLAGAHARASTLGPHGTVLRTGSAHTVGDALRPLGLDATISAEGRPPVGRRSPCQLAEYPAKCLRHEKVIPPPAAAFCRWHDDICVRRGSPAPLATRTAAGQADSQ